MTWFEALLLGLIQGVTEFFPVSSSGHLVLGQAVLGLELEGILFDVALHVATLVSVLFVYRETISRLIRGMAGGSEASSWPYIGKLVLATIPAAAVGLTLQDWFELRFADPVFASTMLLVTGALVWSTRWALGTHRFGVRELLPLLIAALLSLYAGTALPFVAVLGLQVVVMAAARLTAPTTKADEEPNWTDAILMGIAQAIAIFPGISRSGSTVVTGLWRRVDPVRAAEFSFLMSVPAIVGAAILQVPDAIESGMTIPMASLLVGALAAAISGVLAIRFFVALLRRRNFHIFAYYCWVVAALFLILHR